MYGAAGARSPTYDLTLLQEDVRRLQSDKSTLEAKLKEALAAQPAALDPRELAKAQRQIQDLMKENELLTASLPAEKPKPAPAPDTKSPEETKHALTEANRKLTETTRRADTLVSENDRLRKQLAASPATDAETARKLAAAEARLAKLQSEVEIARLEKVALENRVKTLTHLTTAAPGVSWADLPPASRPADAARIKLLEAERNELARKLEAANKELAGRKSRAGGDAR